MITNKSIFARGIESEILHDNKLYTRFPEELIELYRFLAAICTNLPMSNFEGFEQDDVWLAQDGLNPDQFGRLKQIAENVGELWPLLRGNRRVNGSIEENLELIERILTNLLKRYPNLTFKRGAFLDNRNAYCLDRGTWQPMCSNLGDHPGLAIWEQIVTQEEYEYLQKCIYKNGCWRRQLAMLLPVFKIARRKIVEYL